MTKIEKTAPKWHAEVAAQIAEEYVITNEMNETARRRRARIGLMLIWVKEAGKEDGSIPHGMFGPWLEKNLPKLPRATLGDYITEAKSICDLCGWKLGELPQFKTPPHLLLAAKTTELKGGDLSAHNKLAKVIEQQSHFRAVTQYKQVELRDDATVPKIGRAKGSDGNPRDKRLKAQALKQAADLAGRKAQFLQLGELADLYANDAGAGDPELHEEFAVVFPQIENLFRFMQRANP